LKQVAIMLLFFVFRAIY